MPTTPLKFNEFFNLSDSPVATFEMENLEPPADQKEAVPCAPIMMGNDAVIDPLELDESLSEQIPEIDVQLDPNILPAKMDYFDYVTSDSTFHQKRILIRYPLYEEIALEWEIPQMARGKPTGQTIWTVGSAEDLCNNLQLTFPTLKYLVPLKIFTIAQNGYLRTIHPNLLKKYIADHTSNTRDCPMKKIKDAIERLECICSIDALPDHTAEACPFENKILGMQSQKPYAFLKWHNLTYLSNIAACPPIFDQYIHLLFPDPIECDKVLAYMCYLLHESKAIQQNLWIVGEPGDGKSQLLDFIGNTIISFKNADLNQILDDRASESSLRNTHALIFDEVKFMKMDANFVEKIKRWAIQKTLNVRGGYEAKSIDMPWYGRVIMASNALPHSSYLDSAFFVRHCIVHSHKSFTGPVISNFADLLLKEKDAIWSWIYDTYHLKMEAVLGIRSTLTEAAYRKDIDMFHQFLDLCQPADDYITSTEFYNAYCLFDKRPLGASEFFRRIKKQDGIEQARVSLENGGRIRVYYVKIDSPQPITPPDGIDNPIPMEKINQKTDPATEDISALLRK
jgi:hypothetical protein